ncbi:AAA family ATPase [Cloacibacterium normanense]|uniref:AAA family ATPase n=1 Tax=Cloacibacterium normanense TaxID=237258 RepID=UPI00352EC619
MDKIDTLQLHNFKFFNEQEPIKLGGKHLLLYGENGSGKSSIYWALYTLFEAAQKQDNEEIKKYFKKESESPETLLNIYAEPIIESDGTEHYNSYVSITTDSVPPKTFEISLLNTSINSNTEAKQINQASDFLNYKVLYKFQDFWNGEPIDLANIFIGYILPYVTFSEYEIWRGGSLVKKSNAYEMWKEVKQGPGKTLNANGKEIQVYKYSEENKQFDRFCSHFENEMQDLIDFINANASEILQKLGYDIDFHLDYTQHTHKKVDVLFHCSPFKIELKITKYLGKSVNINRPQSFLNEAKMTAIAIAIRLAVLRKRINTEVPDLLKFIVFDDVMISLDMNNRDKLIDFLLDENNGFTKDYQLLFLTHDRNLFNFLRDKIRNVGLKDYFIYKEMYVDFISGIEKPVIYDYPNKLKKAEYFLHIHDYPACGIYLRTSCEEILDRLYPDPLKYAIQTNNEGLYESKFQNLNDKISHLEYFCKIENLDFEIFKDLKTYKSVVLNSLAHNDISSPIYKVELEKVLKVLTELDKIKRDIIIKPSGKNFKIIFTKTDGTLYQIGIEIRDALKLLLRPDGTKVISNFCKTNLNYINDNGVETHNLNIEKESITQIVEEKCVELGISMIDIPSNTFYRGVQKLKDIINLL